MGIFQPLTEIDWVDQVLHGLAGAAVVGLSMLLIPWWGAMLVSMTIAVGREQWQHPFRCHEGCRTDLAYWALGSLGAAIVGYIYRSM